MFRRNHLVFVALVSFVLAGCRTPPPSLNPFAGYGSPRVPPPATGSYSVPNNYYPAAPPAGSTSRSTLPQSGGGAALLASGQWRPLGSGGQTPSLVASAPVGTGVAQPAASQPAAAVASTPTPPMTLGTFPTAPAAAATAAPPAAGTGTTATAAPARLAGNLQLKPMPVTDATASAEPARFVPATAATALSPRPSTIPPVLPGSYQAAPQVAQASFPAPTAGAAQAGVPAASGTTVAATGPAAAASQSNALGWRPKFAPAAAPTIGLR